MVFVFGASQRYNNLVVLVPSSALFVVLGVLLFSMDAPNRFRMS
jgi:hypothetical protein